MFGGLSFMVDDRMAVAAGRDGHLLVRTDPAKYDDLLRRGGEPAHMGNDRAMGRGWLTVPSQRIQDDAELAYWVTVGIDSRNASH
jgi:TfoX/Sxy family transcriptional regulator of competence genes